MPPSPPPIGGKGTAFEFSQSQPCEITLPSCLHFCACACKCFASVCLCMLTLLCMCLYAHFASLSMCVCVCAYVRGSEKRKAWLSLDNQSETTFPMLMPYTTHFSSLSLSSRAHHFNRGPNRHHHHSPNRAPCYGP